MGPKRDRNTDLFIRFVGLSEADLEQMLRESMSRYIRDPNMPFEQKQAEMQFARDVSDEISNRHKKKGS